MIDARLGGREEHNLTLTGFLALGIAHFRGLTRGALRSVLKDRCPIALLWIWCALAVFEEPVLLALDAVNTASRARVLNERGMQATMVL